MSESKCVETKDYWTVIALEACGHIAEKITTVDTRDGKNKLLVFHFSEKAAEDYDAWTRGETRLPFEVVRRVQSSQRQFKANLGRLTREN